MASGRRCEGFRRFPQPPEGRTMLHVLLVFVQGAAAPAATAAPASPPLACAGSEHRQFDFWIGEWSVTPTGKTKLVGSSLIEKLYGGCAVRENWMPLSGSAGGSLNSFYDGQWPQTWVDSSNSRVEFTGG